MSFFALCLSFRLRLLCFSLFDPRLLSFLAVDLVRVCIFGTALVFPDSFPLVGAVVVDVCWCGGGVGAGADTDRFEAGGVTFNGVGLEYSLGPRYGNAAENIFA